MALFRNLRQFSTPNDWVTAQEAGAVADEIIKRAESGTPVRSLQQFEAMLRSLRSDGKMSSNDRFAIYRNALNPNDQGLVFGTAAITFRTFDVYELTSTALVNDRGGKLLAKHKEHRVVEIGAQETTSVVWDTQRDFDT